MVQAGQAEGIANKYKTWRGLYEAYEACSTLKQKQDMLVGIDVRLDAISMVNCSDNRLNRSDETETARTRTERLALLRARESTFSCGPEIRM